MEGEYNGGSSAAEFRRLKNSTTFYFCFKSYDIFLHSYQVILRRKNFDNFFFKSGAYSIDIH